MKFHPNLVGDFFWRLVSQIIYEEGEDPLLGLSESVVRELYVTYRVAHLMLQNEVFEIFEGDHPKVQEYWRENFYFSEDTCFEVSDSIICLGKDVFTDVFLNHNWYWTIEEWVKLKGIYGYFENHFEVVYSKILDLNNYECEEEFYRRSMVI